LIDEYAEQLNNHPEWFYDKGEVMPAREGLHGVAGFLGVVGNIATCNFIHASVLLQLAESETDCGCAGDDAAIVCRLSDEETIFTCVSLLGILQTEKVYRTSEGDALYLKRHIYLTPGPHPDDDQIPRLRDYIQIPSMIHVMTDTEMARWREGRVDFETRRSICISSISAFFRSVDKCKDDPNYSQVQCANFIQSYYRSFNPHLPFEGVIGWLSGGKHNMDISFLPSIRALGSGDYVKLTAELLYNDSVELPCRDECEILYRGQLRTNDAFWSFSTPKLSLLCRLGILSRVGRRKRVYYGRHGFSLLLDELKKFPRPPLQPNLYITSGYIPIGLHSFWREIEVLDVDLNEAPKWLFEDLEVSTNEVYEGGIVNA